jgi:hypothetical protein
LPLPDNRSGRDQRVRRRHLTLTAMLFSRCSPTVHAPPCCRLSGVGETKPQRGRARSAASSYPRIAHTLFRFGNGQVACQLLRQSPIAGTDKYTMSPVRVNPAPEPFVGRLAAPPGRPAPESPMAQADRAPPHRPLFLTRAVCESPVGAAPRRSTSGGAPLTQAPAPVPSAPHRPLAPARAITSGQAYPARCR